jgi:hypothetical protein
MFSSQNFVIWNLFLEIFKIPKNNLINVETSKVLMYYKGYWIKLLIIIKCNP